MISGAQGRALCVLDARASEVDRVVPNTGIWLEGLRASATHVGARGYRYPAFDGDEASTLDAYALIVYVSGRTPIRRVTGARDERYEVGPGDLSLQPASTPSRWTWSNPIDVLHVYIDPVYLHDIAMDEHGPSARLRMRYALRVHDPDLTGMAVDLIDELATARLASMRSACAIGERMAIHLLRHHFDLEAAERGVRSFSGAEVAALRLILEGRIDRETCVAEMASAVGLGVAHFGRVFRDTFGRAPHDYLRERRLARAHELLISTAMSIADIAGRTGFADQSHMTRCFKQRFGAPPAHLRRIEGRPSSGRTRQDL